MDLTLILMIISFISIIIAGRSDTSKLDLITCILCTITALSSYYYNESLFIVAIWTINALLWFIMYMSKRN